MSEVYYIMAEYLASTGSADDMAMANSLLNEVRLARGSKRALNITSRGDFMDALVAEMTREMMTEGQTFFQYKRLGRPLYNGPVPLDMSGRWVLPVPRSENEYNVTQN
jgi:hypothetical protein